MKITKTTKIMSKMVKKDKWVTKKMVTPELREEVILYWRVSKENGSDAIAKKFGLTVYMVNGILDRHLKERTFAND